MTNEVAIEQIKILKAFTGYDKDNQMVTKLHEALDMAIQALKEPHPTKPRPITGEGAYVLDIETGDVMTNGEYERRHAQPQIKKGKWIDGYCSECGKSCLCDGWGNDIESKFCPECGSFNGGGEDEVSD